MASCKIRGLEREALENERLIEEWNVADSIQSA
jgi:hypothetical protein